MKIFLKRCEGNANGMPFEVEKMKKSGIRSICLAVFALMLAFTGSAAA